MEHSGLIPTQLRRYRDRGAPDLHLQFGNRQLAQLLSLCLVAIVMIPLAFIIIRAIGAGQEGLEYMLQARNLRIMGNSIALVVAVTFLASSIGIPYAWLTSRSDLPGQRIWLVLGLLAMVIPSYLTAVTFTDAFGPKGALQQLLEPFGVDRLPNIKGFAGACLTLTFVTFPYVLLPLRAAFLHSDRSLEEAGHSLGLNRWQVFAKITLPQLQPALTAGMLMVALYCLADFGAVAVMRFNAFTRAIFLQTESYRMDKASVLALALVTLTVLLLVLRSRVQHRGRHYRIGAGANRQLQTVRLGKWRFPALLFCGIVVFVGVGIPLLVLLDWLTGRTLTNPCRRLNGGAAAQYCRRQRGLGACRGDRGPSAGAAGAARVFKI